MSTDGFNKLTVGKDGTFLYNTNDHYIGQALAKYGEYGGLEMNLFKQICTAGNVVIEVGANLGAHTVGLARLVGKAGRILAFEPQRLVFQTLCANVALNSLDNVECIWSAVSDQPGFITVPEISPYIKFNFGGVSLVGANDGLRVPCVTLDEWAQVTRLDLLKIDVEGMERDVIRGAEKLLKRFKPTMYVENDRLEQSQQLIEQIAGFGYRLFWHMPALFNPSNFRGDVENIFPNVISCNMLCVHSEKAYRIEGMEEVKDASFHPMRR